MRMQDDVHPTCFQTQVLVFTMVQDTFEAALPLIMAGVHAQISQVLSPIVTQVDVQKILFASRAGQV